jgi:predicted MPP superfamily phosphohydrolase
MSGAHFLLVKMISTALDGLMAVAALVWARRRGRPPAAALAVAVAVAAAGFVAKLAIWERAGLNVFGTIHLAYLDLVVVPPLILLGSALLDAGGPAWRRALTVALGLLAPAVGLYATFVEPYWLRLETTTIHLPPARRPAHPIKVGVLADIQTAHVTAHEHRAVDWLMSLQPDLVLLPGDLFPGARSTLPAELDGLRRLMAKLHAPGGVYFVLGDADDLEETAAIFAGTSVRVLVDETERIVLQGRPITIGGVELDVRKPAAQRFLDRFQAIPGDGDIRLLVTHWPDAVLQLARPTRVDLVVAGHTHGGQVQLPFVGAPMVLTKVPREVGAGGYHQVDGCPIYVSRGVGFEGGQAPRIRFLCRPEVTLLTLE